jgi:ribosomal protein L17
MKQPLAVSFHQKESLETVLAHLKSLSSLVVNGYTTDGKRGLVMAHRQVFPRQHHKDV